MSSQTKIDDATNVPAWVAVSLLTEWLKQLLALAKEYPGPLDELEIHVAWDADGGVAH
ncbi:MAG TPA: hypothetical protein VIT65_26325 [Microlunatus sp.]